MKVIFRNPAAGLTALPTIPPSIHHYGTLQMTPCSNKRHTFEPAILCFQSCGRIKELPNIFTALCSTNTFSFWLPVVSIQWSSAELVSEIAFMLSNLKRL